MKNVKFNLLINLIFGENVVNKKSIINASFLSYINLFFSTILGFIILPLMVNKLGSSQYGIYVLLISTIGYFSLFNLGFTDSITKFVSEYHTLNKFESIKNISATSTYFFLLISLIIFILSIISVKYLPFYFNIDKENIFLFQTAFLLLAINFIISLQGGLLASIISGYQNTQFVKLVNLIQILLYNSLIFTFIQFGFGLLGIIYSAIVSSLFFYVSCLVYIYVKKINYTFNVLNFDRNILKSMLPYSIKIFVMTLTSQILYRSDAIVIGVFLGTVSLTNFDVMYKISIIVATLSTAFSDVLFPTFARLNTLNDKTQINKLLQLNLFISFSIVSFLIMFLYVCGESIFAIWFGNTINISIYVFMLMLSVNFFHAIGPCFTALKAIGKIKLVMYSSIINAIFNLLLSIYLAKKIGIAGVLLATIISHFFTDTLISLYSVNKYLNTSIIKLVRNSMAFPVLISVFLFPFCKFYFTIFKINEINIITIITTLIATILTYFLLHYFFLKKYIKKLIY